MLYYPYVRTIGGICGALLLFASLAAPPFEGRGPAGYKRVRAFVAKLQPTQADRYAQVIEWFTGKYGHEQSDIAAQLWVENRFKWWGTSETGCVGPSQINPFHWGWIFFTDAIDSGHLGDYLRLKGITDPTSYMRRIGYSVEGMCWIMRYLQDTYSLTYEQALVVYGHKHGLKRIRAGENPRDFEYVQKWREIRRKI